MVPFRLHRVQQKRNIHETMEHRLYVYKHSWSRQQPRVICKFRMKNPILFLASFGIFCVKCNDPTIWPQHNEKQTQY